MLILAHLLNAIAVVLNMLLSMLVFVVIIQALISWVNPDPYNPIVRFLHAVTDPMLKPLRRRIPPLGGTIDVTPILLLMLIYLVQYSLPPLLADYALTLRRMAIQ